MKVQVLGNIQHNGEDSEKEYDLKLWGCVQVDARASREQQGIKWLCSVLSAWSERFRKLVNQEALIDLSYSGGGNKGVRLY